MARPTRPLLCTPLLALLALGLTGPRVDAHPLIRLHVRPAAYRLAPPRLPSVLSKAAGLVPLGASLLPAGLVPAGAVPQAALNILRRR